MVLDEKTVGHRNYQFQGMQTGSQNVQNSEEKMKKRAGRQISEKTYISGMNFERKHIKGDLYVNEKLNRERNAVAKFHKVKYRKLRHATFEQNEFKSTKGNYVMSQLAQGMPKH